MPYYVLMTINGIRKPTDLRYGQKIKILRGPFHAVVYKGEKIMDVFLHNTFVRRVPVCVGTHDTATPKGCFRLAKGGKAMHARYTPPVSSGKSMKTVLWSNPRKPEYPLGPDGRWISLQGITDGGRDILENVATLPRPFLANVERATDIAAEDGYGVHGTDDPSSIGQAKSYGCIRLHNKDIAWLFSVLYEHWSTVTIRD